MMSTTRRLAAIMFTDIAGYTAMMQENEARAVEIRQRHREVFERLHQQYRGQIIQYYGDGTLSIFESAVDAATCAVEMQKEFRQEPQVPLRIGLHIGDIMVSETEIIGDGVNVASRVESLAVPGSVLVSENLHDNIKNQEEFPSESLGIFTFKNVAKPVEVFALSSDGLEVPDPKKLSGKYIKRISSKKDWFSKQPIWFRYVAGLVLFLAVAPFIYAPILGLFDAGAAPNEVTFVDENGNKITRKVIPAEDRKTLYIGTFENLSGDSTLDWVGTGLPYAMELDFDQDPYTYNSFEEGTDLTSLNEQMEAARKIDAQFLIRGQYTLENDEVTATVSIHTLPNGKRIRQLDLSASDVLPLADSLTYRIKQELELPEEHLMTFSDLSLEGVLTRKPEAYEAFIKGMMALHKQDPSLFTLLQEPTKIDPTFSWAAFYYANSLYYFQRSESQLREYLDMAMNHMDRMPEIFSITIRQLNYKVNGEPEKALKLARLMTEMEPEKSNHWSSLIRESYAMEEYELCLKALNQYRTLNKEADYQRVLEARCLFWLGNYQEALNSLDIYLSEGPKDPTAMLLKGQLLLATDRREEAKALFEQGSLIFEEQAIWERLITHCEYIEEQGPLTQDRIDAYLGEYRVQGLNSFRLKVRTIGSNLVMKAGEQPNIVLYPYENNKFTMVYDAKILFVEDSTTGEITNLIMAQPNQHQFRANHLDDRLVKIYDGFEEGKTGNLIGLVDEVLAEKPENEHLFAIRTYLASPQKHVLTEKNAAKYLGTFTFDNQTYLTEFLDGKLRLTETTVQQGLDPSVLYPYGEDRFFVLENINSTVIIETKGNQAIRLGFHYFEADTTLWSE